METTTQLTIPTDLEKQIDSLFAQQTISRKDIEGLTNADRAQLSKEASRELKTLRGTERDSFVEKIDQIITPDTKSSLWEYNHAVISSAIANHLEQQGSMPNKTAIAEQTGLSRQTVTKHFKEYKQQPEFTGIMEQFKFMSHKVLAGVFQYATNGDMRAARLYLEMVGAIDKRKTAATVNTQHNYIQINNTILSHEHLKQLTAEQLNQIESIINTGQAVMIAL